jgi:CHAT domain-containing protein
MALPRPRPSWMIAAIAVAGVLAVVVFGAVSRRADLLGALGREARSVPVAGVRLSVASRFRPCPAALAHCPGEAPSLSPRAIGIIQSAAEAARAGTDPGALHAAAVANMLFSESQKNLLDVSVSYLQSAATLSERPATILADLSAAYLLRAQETGSAHDLFRALEAAETALEMDAGDLGARFNAAESMDRIGLRRESAAAWARYLAADSTSPWGVHAKARHRALSGPAPDRTPPGPQADAAGLAAFAERAPKEAREHGWDTLLGEWGTALLAGDTATAQRRLEQAEVLGTTLARRGGDASLADAVAEIRRRTGPALRRLAAAHQEFSATRKVYQTDHGAGCNLFKAHTDKAGSKSLREWTRTFVGICAAYSGGAPDAIRMLTGQVREADEGRFPASAGRRHWALGLAYQRANRYDSAMAAYRRAERLFRRTREFEFEANVRMLVGNALVEMGNANEGHALLHEALSVLRDYPGTPGLYKNLYALRNASLADGMLRAAIPIQDEAVAEAEKMDPVLRVETVLTRARLRLAAGHDDVSADIALAESMVAALDSSAGRNYMQAELDDARGTLWLITNTAEAVTALDTAVAFFASEPTRQIPILFTRAEARMRLNQHDSARADLERAMLVLDGARDQVGSAQLRGSLLEASRRVFDQATMLNVRTGRVQEALENVERSRASFSPVERRNAMSGRRLRSAPGQVGIEFALVGDTLLTWTLSGTELQLRRATIDRDALGRNVERVRSGLELRAPDQTVLPGLEALYNQLIRPIAARLGRETELVIVADGELAAVPMVALRDSVRGRYLMEDHVVRFAGSLRDPALAAAPPAADTRVTLVADPAFDPGSFPGLRRLTGAAAEVAALQRLYPHARTLQDDRAVFDSIRDALGRSGIYHFAGHAVFDDARPERSYLVAAAGGASARLTAAEIERMQLQGLRLVVLSACRTSRAQAGRSGGFAGLAGAFLAAGAGGVVGSLWTVQDGQEELMRRFHQAYLASGDAAAALRQAQLGMLRSTNPALRSPAAWAGFRYTGG